MIKSNLTLGQLAVIAGTRGMLGVGLGLLLADKLAPERRKGIGAVLVAAGVFSTLPLAIMVASRRETSGSDEDGDAS